jgi:hypothetical protein
MKNIESKILSVKDAKYFAKKRVPKGIFQMFEAGSGSNSIHELDPSFVDLPDNWER